MFCGCLVTWCSKLQRSIVLSTTESKCIALSTATRELLPLCHILIDIHNYSFIQLYSNQLSDTIKMPSFPPSKVFEDNNACIVLASTEVHFKPCTKHTSLKYHHLHDQVCRGTLKNLKIVTNDNIADIFTKPLGRFKFQYL
jgi:hypothetical protein